MKHCRTTFLFIILGAFLIGCGKSADHEQESDTLRAYRLIDENREDEAISLMENALRRDPENSDYKVILASAYAHKSGLIISKIFPAFKKASQISELEKNFKPKKIAGSHLAQIDNYSYNVSGYMQKISAFFEVYRAIPKIKSGKLIYLSEAINILNRMGKKLKPEDVVYRTVLEVVMLKQIISEHLLGEIVDPRFVTETCKFDIGTFNDHVIKAGKLLIDIFNDIGFVNPKAAIRMKALANDTSEHISNITLMTTSVAVLDEVTNTFLKSVAKGYNFGRIVKCDGEDTP